MASHKKFGILTVNQPALSDRSLDKGGPAVQATLESKGFTFTRLQLVGEAEAEVRAALKAWCEEGGVDVIFTVGNTGFGPQERVPEAVSSLIDRHASGLVHLIMSVSLQHTDLAAISRPVAGTYKDTLIVTLPGSSKAVDENLQALLNGGVLERILAYQSGVRARDHSGNC